MEPAGFWRYRDELDKMPRDLPLDPETMLGCFARAFGAVNTTTLKPDLIKLKRVVADPWRDYIRQIPIADEKGMPLTGSPLADELQAKIKAYVDPLKKPTP